MRVFAIGDLHLAGGSGKTMDKFGEHWRDHDRKIFESWEQIGRDDDLLILAGDISWAMRLEDALPDLNRIGQMKGRKLMIKGNHDYWWASNAKLHKVLSPSIDILHGSSAVIGAVAVAGTRGWICPGDTFFRPDDLKIYNREVGRLKLALDSLQTQGDEFGRLVVVLHYPPTNDKGEPSGFTDLLDQYRVDECVYGHLHGDAIKTGITGLHGNTTYHLVSADAVDFAPKEVAE